MKPGRSAGFAIDSMMAGLLVLGIMGCGLLWQYHVIGAKEIEIRALEQAAGQEKESRAQFQSAAAICSQSVKDLASAGKKASLAAAAALADAKRSTAASNISIAEILAAPRPAGLDACQNAERILNAEIDRHHGHF